MDQILAVDTDLAVHEKASAEWAKCGVSIQRVDTMHDAIVRLMQSDNYLFVGIFEDTVPDFMLMLPIIRDVTDVPIFVMSTTYTIDKSIKALSLGADVYDHYHAQTNHNVLHALELLKARQRRSDHSSKTLKTLICGNIVLSLARRKTFMKGVEIQLGKKEFDILRILIENCGEVIGHEQLLREIWGEQYSKEDSDVLWRTVNRLRTKLSQQSSSGRCIRISRGVGYAIDP